MSPKTRRIIGWVLSGLLVALFLWSGSMKFMVAPEMEKKITEMGFTMDAMHILGVLEILSAILFLIPRTGVLGTMLLAAYMGGAICAHITTHQAIWTPVIVEAVIWITALIRFPEIGWRLFRGHAD